MTISEIAKLAGVSPASVSRYLNNGYISQDKKEKIRRVVEETGYRPSLQAQMLRTKKTGMIGVVLPKIDSEAVSRIAAGISQGIAKRNYAMLLANTENDIEKELEYLSVFNNDRVDGIIFSATVLTEEHKKLLQKLKVPVVIVGQCCEYASCVYHDDKSAAAALTKLLLQRGRKNIAYLGVTRQDRAAGEQRYEGFMEAIREESVKASVRAKAENQYICEFTLESGYEKCKEAFAGDNTIDGIFCATDMIALGAMKYLREIGKRLPEEVSLTGIGHTRVSELIQPSLTTAHFYYKESGSEAVSMLFDMMGGEAPPRKKVMMGYEIIEQESV